MAAIYNADTYCDDCADNIKDNIDTDGIPGFDPNDERTYDSGEYPKYRADTEESDCPEHCAKCETFLGNDLTVAGYDYVADAIQNDLEDGYLDSIAITVWAEFYGLSIVMEIDICGDECSKLANLLCDYNTAYRVCRA